MSDRLSGRVESTATNHQVSGGFEGRSANDSLVTPVRAARITRTQVARIGRRLSDTDRQVIEVLSTVRIATGRQLQRLLWDDTPSGKRLARHHLARLTDLRVLARLGRRIGGVRAGSAGFTYTLDVAGQRIADSDRSTRALRPHTPSDLFINHQLAVTQAFVDLWLAEQAGTVEVIDFDVEPVCWRPYVGPGGRQLTLKPDAYTEWQDDQWHSAAFLEIDCGTENPARITRKAKQYVSYRQTGLEQAELDLFPEVIWISPDEQREAVITAALAAVDGGDDLFRSCTAVEFARRLKSPGGES
jgi:hypothetical protein